MANIILETIPEYLEEVAAAERAEAEARELPFFDCPVEICGIQVKQFTPRHFMTLAAARSPFFYGGEVQPEDFALFMAVVSVEFSGATEKQKTAFVRKIHKLDCFTLEDGIREYIDAAFADSPSSQSAEGKSPTTSLAASVVHEIGKAYGWSRREILDTPFAELFQYFRLIARDEYARCGKRYLVASRARLRINRRWLKKISEEGGDN